MGHAEPRAPSAEPATILVADDSDLNRALFRRLLIRAGHSVIETRDGCETLAEIERCAPDLMLLDLHMPGIAGIEVLRQVRRDHDPAPLPVIIVTADTDVEMAVRCLAAGANDYVTKPVVWSVLRARLETYLSLQRAHAELMDLYKYGIPEFGDEFLAD